MCNAEILVTKSFERKSGKSESRPFLKSVETTQKRVPYEQSGILKTEFIWLFFNTNTAKESLKRKALEAQNIYVIIN